MTSSADQKCVQEYIAKVDKQLKDTTTQIDALTTAINKGEDVTLLQVLSTSRNLSKISTMVDEFIFKKINKHTTGMTLLNSSPYSEVWFKITLLTMSKLNTTLLNIGRACKN